MRLKQNGIEIWPIELVAGYTSFLSKQLELILSPSDKIRPWHFWELHNPWSRSSLKVDSWKFLDLCKSPKLVEKLRKDLGEDIILFESKIVPDVLDRLDPKQSLKCDKSFYPVTPIEGLAIRIPIQCNNEEYNQFIYKDLHSGATESIKLSMDNIIVHSPYLPYYISNSRDPSGSYEYVVRYFPATSQFIRDPGHPPHPYLTEQYPLLNYAKLPLWLISGEDRAKNDFVTGFSNKPGRWV